MAEPCALTEIPETYLYRFFVHCMSVLIGGMSYTSKTLALVENTQM